MAAREDDDLVIKTSSGRVCGFTDRGVPNWRGVPYGRVPERFRPPAPAGYTDLLDAREWGSVSWQAPLTAKRDKRPPLYPDTVQSEQCLNLNVWSPAPDGNRRPVLVWFHPGRHMVGGGNMPNFDAWVFPAYHDVVIVTANYRLGPWGWLYLGALEPHFADGSNLAIHDHLLLLQWVRENIAEFGGDPDNVTIFGMSSGGTDVTALLGTPAARGLFHKAAVYSGTAEHSVGLSDAAAFAERFVSAAGTLVASPADLAKVSNVALRHAHRKALADGPVVYNAAVDGRLIDRPLLQVIREGNIADVPVLLSVTSDEARIFDLVSEHAVDDKFRAVVGDPGEIEHEEKIRILTRKLYVEQAEKRLAAIDEGGGNCWAQVFDYHPTTSSLAANPRLAGRAAHAADATSLFCDLDAPATSATDRAVGTKEMGVLITLARDGGLPWPRYDPEHPVAEWIGPAEAGISSLRPLP